MAAARIRNEEWTEDLILKEEMQKLVQKGLQRKEILSFMIRDFGQYAWSMRTLDRRLRHFGICYTDTNVTVDEEQPLIKSLRDPAGVVQMHQLARNLAGQLQEKVENDDDLIDTFGDTFRYRTIYLGTLPNEEFIIVEEFVERTVAKLVNNNGLPCGNDEISQKAECLSHFSYEKTNEEVMLVDIQGCGYDLFDPEIASSVLLDTSNNEIMFTTGNLSTTAIQNLVEKHVCNLFCRCLGLTPLR